MPVARDLVTAVHIWTGRADVCSGLSRVRRYGRFLTGCQCLWVSCLLLRVLRCPGPGGGVCAGPCLAPDASLHLSPLSRHSDMLASPARQFPARWSRQGSWLSSLPLRSRGHSVESGPGTVCWKQMLTWLESPAMSCAQGEAGVRPDLARGARSWPTDFSVFLQGCSGEVTW